MYIVCRFDKFDPVVLYCPPVLQEVNVDKESKDVDHLLDARA